MVVALLLTAGISIGTVFLPNLTAPLTNAMKLLSTPFRATATFFVNRVEAMYDYAFRYQYLESRVAELEEQVAQLSEENRAATDALEENERLRSLLELAQAHEDFTFESARVTGRSASSWTSALTISKGSASGVEEDMLVVTEYGYLVGVVSEVGTNWATVTTLIDPDIAVSVKDSQSGDTAVLTGSLDAMLDGLCRLSYLGSEAEVSVGDTILTSGLGGVYPAGIVVGTISECGTTISGMELYALVTPAADLDELEQVFVIKDFDIEE